MGSLIVIVSVLIILIHTKQRILECEHECNLYQQATMSQKNSCNFMVQFEYILYETLFVMFVPKFVHLNFMWSVQNTSYSTILDNFIPIWHFSFQRKQFVILRPIRCSYYRLWYCKTSSLNSNRKYFEVCATQSYFLVL